MERFVNKDHRLRDSLKFGRVCSTIAMKFGSSEVRHVDFSDDPRYLTWIVPLGNWTGGLFEMPELGMSVDVRPGQVLAALTRVIVHSSTTINGERFIMIFFMHRNLLSNADKAHFGANSYILTDIASLYGV